MAPTRKLAYVVVCSAPPALHVQELVQLLHGEGWDAYLIATPTAGSWIDVEQLGALAGFPVRIEPHRPNDSDPLPPADAIAVAPATFNTINKWAAGISDTFALGLLNEAVGLDQPIVAVPCVKAALRVHPAYDASIRTLSRCGVTILDPDTVIVRQPADVVTFDWPVVVKALLRR